MTRGRRQQPKSYWRCPRCHELVPNAYEKCVCGHDRSAVLKGDEIIEHAKRVFPGSYEP